MNTIKWLVRREIWEHKSGMLWAPVITGAITIALLVLGMALGSDPDLNGVRVGALSKAAGADQQALLAAGLASNYMAMALPVLITLAFMVFFISLSVLSDERKDRSVLFWKSMPVSDGQTVASKALLVLVVVPAVALLAGIITSLVGLLALLVFGSIHGINLFDAVLSNSALYLAPLQVISVIPVYALWALPAVGWLMLIGAAAPRKAFLWALLLPIMAGVLVSWFSMAAGINTGWFWENVSGRVIFSVVPGSWIDPASFSQSGDLPNLGRAVAQQSWAALGSARLWLGAIAGIGMLFAAAKVRRHAADV